MISRCIFATRFDIHIPRLVDILSLSLDALQLAPLRRIIPHGLEYRLGSYSTNGGYRFAADEPTLNPVSQKTVPSGAARAMAS